MLVSQKILVFLEPRNVMMKVICYIYITCKRQIYMYTGLELTAVIFIYTVSTLNDGVSAIYEVKITTVYETDIITPIWFESETNSLGLEFNPFATKNKEVNIPFNNWQLQVERKDKSGATTYKITFGRCSCVSDISGSIVKMTPSGFQETVYLSRPYVSLFYDYLNTDGNNKYSVRINRTALEKDALEIKSVDFSIEMMDNTPDLIDMLTYKFSLDVTQNIKV